MSEIFSLQNTDKRQEFIRAMEQEEKWLGQKLGGKEVDYFSADTGFVLLKRSMRINPQKLGIQRVIAIARLSLGPQLELREFYYTLRGQPDLVKPFASSTNIYATVLESIKDTEVLCDINRAQFTVGNLPKGFVHYGHSSAYGNAEKPIGLTENVARRVLSDYEVEYAMNIIHMEKSAAATRLVSMGFSTLTNSVISTTGGNFTRAVYVLARRFNESKKLMFFCDGDAFGNDMLRALEFGTMASRHLTPEQAFPSSVYGNIHIAGLFPSVAEELGIPNDVEQKRPMSNPFVKKRVEFLKRYDLINQKDIDTWERNQTFELEALSTFFKANNGTPVGLGIYMIEFMRLNGLQCKPQPPEDDEELIEELNESAEDKFKRKIKPSIDMKFTNEIVEAIKEPIREWLNGVAEEVFEEHVDDLRDTVRDQSVEIVRNKVAKQYERDPHREIYDMDDVADNLFETVEVEVETPGLDEIVEKVRELLENIKPELKKIMEEWRHDETVEFKDIRNPGEPRDFYDVVLEEIGADPADAEKVREALRRRLEA